MAEELSVKIGGMHCGGCVARVTNALKNVSGVTVEDVQVGSARVRYESPAASPAAITAAIRNIGFEVKDE